MTKSKGPSASAAFVEVDHLVIEVANLSLEVSNLVIEVGNLDIEVVNRLSSPLLYL
ncbi:MAG TPA: hypothetical protein VGQ46_05235 [Thermoanaerobaculia bacterium]|nr:hypothetical protein [Thermoanaerobaculia bacterium]